MNDFEFDVEEELLAPLYETAVENGETFYEMFERSGCDVRQFVSRDKYIPVRSTQISSIEAEDVLYHQHDVDGVVIQWRTLEGIDFEVPYIDIIPKGLMSIKSVYDILKKHFDLKKFDRKSLSVFRRCVGARLCYSGGWETWMALIPEYDLENELTAVDFTSFAVKVFTRLRVMLQKIMKENIGKGTVDVTLSKNNLGNLSYMRIISHEQSKVLSLLQRTLDNLDLDVSGMKHVVFSYRFGEKCPGDFKLPIKDSSSVEAVTVHVGLTLTAICSTEDNDEEEMSTFWSRIGLQEIVGSRGVLTSAYSFSECANFQSALDGREMDITGDLRRVCRYPLRLRFVQLYADMPHRRPNVRVHPVSGATFLMKGVLKNRSHVDADAERYLSEVLNNFEQVTGSRCRLEMVMSLPTDCTLIQPSTLLHFHKVLTLLESHPLIVSFLHPRFPGLLQEVGLTLVEDLNEDYTRYKGTGNSEAVWRVYQRELAVEKLLWGHPFCVASSRFSVNLGPGLAYPTRSETDMMGFLALTASTSCCSDEHSCPPPNIYSKSEIVQKQMRRTFGFHDLIGGSSIVIGSRLVLALLQDVYETGTVKESFSSFLLSLKIGSSSSRCPIVGGTSRKQLAELIGNSQKAKYPMVTGVLLKLLRENKVDTVSVLKAGFNELELARFPSLRIYDEQRHAGLCWKWNYGLLVFNDVPEYNTCLTTKTEIMTALVVRELENRKICHTRVLGSMTFPWIRPCIAKLNDLNLSDDDMVTVLTFVSSIARLMNGQYVDYYKLRVLLTDLPKPVNQRLLQSMNIQSKFLLNNMNTCKIWRLHHSIPFKVVEVSKSNLSNKEVEKKADEKAVAPAEDDVTGRIPPELVEEGSQTYEVVVAEVRHMPPKESLRRWTPVEMAILCDIKENHSMLSIRSMYGMYQEACREKGIPDRSLVSVRRKVSRMDIRSTKGTREARRGTLEAKLRDIRSRNTFTRDTRSNLRDVGSKKS